MTRLVLLCVATLALVGCGGSKVTRHTLKKDAESVQSLAAEGAYLAQEASNGDTTRTFARLHSQELAQKASSIEKTLRAAGRGDRIAALAGRTAAELGRLHSAPNGPPAGQVAHALGQIAAKAGELAK